jgi:hypothetical protein
MGSREKTPKRSLPMVHTFHWHRWPMGTIGGPLSSMHPRGWPKAEGRRPMIAAASVATALRSSLLFHPNQQLQREQP